MSNTNKERITKQNDLTDHANQSATTKQSQWRTALTMGFKSASHKPHWHLYMLLALCAVVLTVAVTAAASSRDALTNQQIASTRTVFLHSEAEAEDANQAQDEEAQNNDTVTQGTRLPSSFRHTQANVLTHPEWLAPAAKILTEAKRPLRVLQIGDSHVAGRSFPLALKSSLTTTLGEASSADEGTGVWFTYVGSNGATSQRFLSEKYLSGFADVHPDLIIVSLGTNEAHGMGYDEEMHNTQLNEFFASLRSACPTATVMLTTPPGDYLAMKHVTYRRTSRSPHKKVRVVSRTYRPNPMIGRCAANIASYGTQHRMTVWDLYNIAGGEGGSAPRNWYVAHLMRADRVHFEPAGYELQGQMLGEAIAHALQGCEERSLASEIIQAQ